MLRSGCPAAAAGWQRALARQPRRHMTCLRMARASARAGMVPRVPLAVAGALPQLGRLVQFAAAPALWSVAREAGHGPGPGRGGVTPAGAALATAWAAGGTTARWTRRPRGFGPRAVPPLGPTQAVQARQARATVPGAGGRQRQGGGGPRRTGGAGARGAAAAGPAHAAGVAPHGGAAGTGALGRRSGSSRTGAAIPRMRLGTPLLSAGGRLVAGRIEGHLLRCRWELAASCRCRA
mmetsp:Transcript_92769/g.262365  ORF Transcript_92769/g.262365 Transcript_92769/m.262365 type:complete len:236 (+) Transcript_92769:1071-1778(+)